MHLIPCSSSAFVFERLKGVGCGAERVKRRGKMIRALILSRNILPFLMLMAARNLALPAGPGQGSFSTL